jgi:tRNA (cytidine32/uridine32-2'-O)-methyltransferase
MISLLDNISIVLVDTRTPANIGSVTRCMMNMGLSRLVLVDPPKDPGQEALKLAAGAQTILEKAVICSTLADAIKDHGLIIGTSRHEGKQRKNIRTPREMAKSVIPMLSRNRVAVVFGNEVNGLENRDLSLCHEIVAIPSSDAFASLNLSHAVMIIAYELYLASQPDIASSDVVLAPAEQVDEFYRHLQTTLQDAGFLERDHPERLMFSLRQLFGRARLDAREVSILRGILSSLTRSARIKDEKA